MRDDPPGGGGPKPRRNARCLAADVARQLKRWMAEKAAGFGPGETLPPISGLARRLKASRPTVRKALDGLAGEGLIVWSGDGAFVARTASATVMLAGREAGGRKWKHPRDDEILACRRWLQPEAAARAAAVARMSVAFRDKVEAASRAIELGQRDDSAHSALRTDRDFHELLFSATPNSLENEIFHVARAYALDALAMSLLFLWVEEAFRKEMFRLNRALFEAVMRGDAVAARAAAENYMDYLAMKYREAKGRSDRTHQD